MQVWFVTATLCMLIFLQEAYSTMCFLAMNRLQLSLIFIYLFGACLTVVNNRPLPACIFNIQHRMFYLPAL